MHPKVDRAPVSFTAAWTNQSPTLLNATDALTNYFAQRGISVITDGPKFLQLVPTSLKALANPRSQDLPSAEAQMGSITLMSASGNQIAAMYAALSGRRHTGSSEIFGIIPYLKIFQPLSQPEVLYSFETLLGWNGLKVIPSDDNTFSIVPRSR